jgi:hypothetical protein
MDLILSTENLILPDVEELPSLSQLMGSLEPVIEPEEFVVIFPPLDPLLVLNTNQST